MEHCSPALLLGGALWAGPGESRTPRILDTGLEVDSPGQRLRFSHKNNRRRNDVAKVMEKARFGERVGGLYVHSHLHSFTQEVCVHCPLWVKGRIATRATLRPQCYIVSSAPHFLLQRPEASGGTFIQTRTGPQRRSSLPFIHPRSVLDSQALEIAWDTGKSWIQLESVEFSLFELT